MGKVNFSLEDFQKAAITFKRELLRIPILGIQDTLQYMTPVPGVTYETIVGTSSVEAQLAPYAPNRKNDVNLDLELRKLATYFGSVNAEFEPNSAITTLMGHLASQASGQNLTATPTAKEVLALIAKKISYHLNAAIWKAKRNESGNSTMDLFDGFDTIAEKEISSGNISAEKGNLVELSETITRENAYDIITQEILYKLDPDLRAEECFMFCDYNTADAYNQAYLMTHSGIVYNDKYNQVTVEGSNNLLHIVPLRNKKGSSFIQVMPKSNALVGFDQLSDGEYVNIKDYAPDTLTFMMRMFFGVQYESIDPRRLCVIKKKESE